MRALLPILLLSTILAALPACKRASPPPSPKSTPPAVGLPVADAVDAAACRFAAENNRPDAIGEIGDKGGLGPYLLQHVVLASGERIDADDGPEFTGADGKARRFEDTALDPDEADRWDDGGYLLPYAGRLYHASFVGKGPWYLHSLSRLTPDHRRLPLCLFETRATAWGGAGYSADRRPGDDKLCEAAWQGTLPVVPTRRKEGRFDKYPAPYWQTDPARVDADIDNDGRRDRLIRIYIASTSNIPCGQDRLFTWPSPDTALGGVVDRALELGPPGVGDRRTRAIRCQDDKVRLLRSGGRTYVETRSWRYRTPQEEDQEYWQVTTIERGTIRRVCTARYDLDTTRIVARWDGKAWSPRPPKPGP